MGNVCPDYCSMDCCDINYLCTINTNDCYYYYYNWAWVYWVCGICVFLFIVFMFIGIIIRNRQRRNRLIVDANNASYTTDTYAVQGQGASGGGYNQVYGNSGQGYVTGQAVYQNQNSQGYQMGQPVFLSGNNQGKVYK